MRKLLIVLMILCMPKANAMSDCEYFILPTLGINQYQTCLQNPSAYSEYFIYHTVRFYNGTSLISTKSVRDGDDVSPPSSPVKSGYTFTGWSKSLSNVSSDLNVYAQFEASGYTIYYKDYDGRHITQETVPPGGNGNPPYVYRTGYTFTGWSGSYTNVTSNRTLIATYRIKSFTVRFFNEGSLLKSEVINYNYSATPPSVPNKLGHTFVGWSDSYKNIKSSVDLHAVYEPIQFQVTFKADDILKVETVPFGESATPPVATKPGYVFVGWDTSYNYITSDVIITAMFEVANYTVTFEMDGVVVKEEVVSYMGNAIPPLVEKEGYRFLGWDGNYSGITSSKTIRAIFEAITYQLTYIDYDGSIYQVEEVGYQQVPVGVTPNREGYHFIGYSEELSIMNQNKSVTLLYEPIVLLVDFMHMDTLIEQVAVEYNGCVIAPLFHVTGFDLIKWDQDLCNIVDNKVINAVTEQKLIPVTFKDYDGSTIQTIDVPFGETAVVSPPSREGYVFSGWSDSLIITKPVTIFATYDVKSYLVEFIVNGEVIQSEYVHHNKNAIPPEVRVEGYDFVGWDKEYSSISYPLRVQAILKAKSYKVTFMDYDMRQLKQETVIHGRDANPPHVEREGYEFVGWSDEYKNIEANNTLIAQYKPIEYEVKLMVNEVVIDIVYVPYLTTYELPKDYVWDFEEIVVLEDITLYGEIPPCFDYYHLDSGVVEVSCGEEVEPEVKEGFIFIRWEQGEAGYYPLYEPMTFEVRFIHDGNIVTKQFLYGDSIEPPTEINGLFINEWDLTQNLVYGEMDIYGYVEPLDKMELKVEHSDNMYKFQFEGSIEGYQSIYLVVDGILHNINAFEHELDELGMFDKKMDWIKVHVPLGEVEKLIIEMDKEYRYNIQNHIQEKTWMDDILQWFKNIF